jgi:hypothetical protein
MGQMLNAICNKCGFQKEVSFGAGMSDFQTVCNVPALNTKTGKLVVKNFLKVDKQANDITFYNDPKMYKGEIEDEYHQWGDIFLSPKNNLCPKCKTYSMNFENLGNFD